MRHIALAAALLITPAYAQDVFGDPAEKQTEWPDGPKKTFFQNLQRPDIHLRQWDDIQPMSCCGEADTVKTKFKVEAGNALHPNDAWYAWLEEKWVRIPPEKIVPDHAPDGQAYLFVFRIAGRNGLRFDEIVCFVRPKGGL